MTGEFGSIGETAGGLCLNCGTRRAGDFCQHCGQSGHVHNTVGSIAHDLMHGVLHLEGKTWRTLPMLAFKPGHLTRRYIAGERARFVSPMAIFLFSVFLMFAVVAQLPGWSFGDSDLLKPGVATGIAQARIKLAEEKARAGADLVRLEQALAKVSTPVSGDEAANAGDDKIPPAERIARLQERIAAARSARDDLAKAEATLPSTSAFEMSGAPASTGSKWLEAKWRHAKENPQLVLYKIKTNGYKYSWALIPISLPFIWLLFPLRRNVGLYDHAIFATYSLGFMSLLVIVLAVLAAIGTPGAIVATAAVLIPPLHLYKQLKYGYGISRVGALWRTFLMLAFALITSIFFALFLVGLGVSG